MNQNLKNKLLDELRVRSYRLMPSHLFMIAVTAFFLHGYHRGELLSYLPYVFIMGSLLIRFMIMKWFFNDYKKQWIVRILHLVFVGTTSLSWGVLFLGVESQYGLLAVPTLFCIGCVMTLLSASATIFSYDMKMAVVFVLSLVALPVYRIFQLDSSFHMIGYLIVANCLYQIRHTRLAHKYLIKTLGSELTAHEQKELLQEYIDALPGIVGVIDSEGTYIMVNNYLDGAVKKTILNTKVGATLKNNPVSELILSFFKSSDKHWVREIHSPNDLAGGNWYMVNLKKISTPQVGVLAAILPINELVKARNDLKIQEARSQYAAKLATLGEFSAGIAHEVSNPLTIIEGAANQLKDVLSSNPNDTKALNQLSQKISETTLRIGRIIKSLRTLAKDAEEEPFGNLTFMSIVEPAREISKQKLEAHGIELRIFGTSNDVALFGNEIQLSQVILNLISNSIDAVKDLPDRWIEIHYRPSFEWSEILVIDSGTGIPRDIKDRVMEPFFTTKNSSHGTGLGLSISHNIVGKHFGELLIDHSAKHTTFTIRLPRMNPWDARRIEQH